MSQILKNLTVCLLLTLALGLAPGLAQASGDAWMTDFDAAQKKAAETGKDLLVDFSGSDWCGWCIKLDDEVFSKPEFVKEAEKDYILVVLDFPRKPENVEKIPEAVRERNDELQKKWAIRGFPTVLLMDAEAKVYARTGYRPGGPETYLKELAQFREDKQSRETLMASLSGKTGMEKARMLDELVEATPADMQGEMRKQFEEIVAIDTSNEAGLKQKYTIKLGMMDMRTAIGEKEFEKAIKICQGLLDEQSPTGEIRQNLLFAMGEPHFGLQQMDKVVECLKGALAAAPESDKAESIKQMIERFSAQAGGE